MHKMYYFSPLPNARGSQFITLALVHLYCMVSIKIAVDLPGAKSRGGF